MHLPTMQLQLLDGLSLSLQTPQFVQPATTETEPGRTNRQEWAIRSLF